MNVTKYGQKIDNSIDFWEILIVKEYRETYFTS